MNSSSPALANPAPQHDVHVSIDTVHPSSRWPWLLALTAIIVLATAGNLYWVSANQMLVGRDASSYLINALKYRDLLTPFTLQGLFKTFVDSPYRTSGLYVVAQPFLLLLPGDPKDAAQLVNVLFHAATILITWMLARTIASRWTSLLAATLIAFLPLMTSMARLFYTEAFLVTMVTLNLLALYRSRGFSVRRWSLLWGASAGVGLLVKWTFPIYIALPLLVDLWRARQVLLPRYFWNPRALLAGAFAGVLFVALWWLPNRTLAATLPAGFWIAPGWFLIAAATIYAIWIAHNDKRWFVAAALLALWVASFWYLPHPNILQTIFAEDAKRGSAPLGLLDWMSFADYLDYLYRQHFGALLFWATIPAAALPWLWTLLRTRRSLCPPANLLWWSLLSALLVLLQISQRNSRNLLPLLPQLAILIALGIGAWPRLPRTLIAIVTLVALLLQWGAITFDAAQPLYALRALWVIDAYSIPPASGKTASDYNIVSDILQEIADNTPPGVNETLGILVNADYLHRGSVRYLINSKDFPVTINDLTETTATWQNLVDSQWVVIKNGNNKDAEPAALALIRRIQDGDPLFKALYHPVYTWSLPNGEAVTLHRREGPGFPDSVSNRSTAAQSIAPALFNNVLPTTTVLYGSSDLAVWLGRFGPPGLARVLSKEWDVGNIALLSDLTGTVAAVLDHNTLPLESWLDTHALRGATFSPTTGDSDLTVVFYDFSDSAHLETIPVTLASNATGAEMLELRSQANAARGTMIQIESSFSADMPGIKWSVRLEDEAGTVFAAIDRPIWAQDRFGLLVPAHIAAGEYQVVARLYDEATLAPIPSTTGVVDVPLFTVMIR